LDDWSFGFARFALLLKIVAAAATLAARRVFGPARLHKPHLDTRNDGITLQLDSLKMMSGTNPAKKKE